MADGMVAATVIVDRQPVVCFRWVPGAFAIMWIGIAQEIPATASVAIHSIGLSLSRPTAFWAYSVHPVDSRFQDAALTGWFKAFNLGKYNRQILLRDRYGAVCVTVNDRN